MNLSGGFALMKSFCFVCAYWSLCFLLCQFLNLPKLAFGWKGFSFWILISSNYTFALLLPDLGTCSGTVRDSFSLSSRSHWVTGQVFSEEVCYLVGWDFFFRREKMKLKRLVAQRCPLSVIWRVDMQEVSSGVYWVNLIWCFWIWLN